MTILLASYSYNTNQLHTLISQIYFWNKILHVSDSSFVHHQEIFTAHTQQWHMSNSFRAGSGRSVLILLESCLTYTIAVYVQ